MFEDVLKTLVMYQECLAQRGSADPYVRLGATMGEINCLVELDLLLFPSRGSDMASIRHRRLEVIRRLRSFDR